MYRNIEWIIKLAIEVLIKLIVHFSSPVNIEIFR